METMNSDSCRSSCRFVAENSGAVFRLYENYSIDPQVFDNIDDDDAEITKYKTGHYSRYPYANYFAHKALKKYHDYYGEVYTLVSMTSVKHKYLKYYITFTARQMGARVSHEVFKTVQAVVISGNGGSTVLYVRIIPSK